MSGRQQEITAYLLSVIGLLQLENIQGDGQTDKLRQYNGGTSEVIMVINYV